MTRSPPRPRIAITFETAGDPAPTVPLLDFLAVHQVKATFFIDGRWGETHAHLVKRIADEGHEFGNHGYHHPDWTTLTDREIAADLQATETLIQKLTGKTTLPWARPPYGAFDNRVVDVLRDAGYRVVYRDAVDGGHWPGETTAESIRKRVRQSATTGAVIVFHTNRVETPIALPGILDDLAKAAFLIGPLGELGEIPTSRQERYPDFSSLEITPGYIRPLVAGRWQSINLLEYGSMAKKETNLLERIAEIGKIGLDLVTGDREKTIEWDLTSEDRYILVLVGELRCDFRDGTGQDMGYLIARGGDLFRCPAGARYRLGPTGESGLRWIAALWRSTS